MDIFSHVLWSIILGKIINIKTKLKVNLKWIGFLGAFPDIFAFTLLFVVSIFTGSTFHPQDHGATQFHWLFKVTELLYSLSHSLVIFAIVIISIYIIKRKVLYVLLGWGLHIILDILTHTKEFFPTPFLYPLSNFLINGITWRQNWFLITNYIVLTTIFTYLYRKELFKFIKKLRILRSK
ncbi:hypothetical protein HOC32_03755 [Candidatus Woesearchaeota archaeon]|nr:hypothetical protein [Candidatus Woesearchaeota archaeon]